MAKYELVIQVDDKTGTFDPNALDLDKIKDAFGHPASLKECVITPCTGMKFTFSGLNYGKKVKLNYEIKHFDDWSVSHKRDCLGQKYTELNMSAYCINDSTYITISYSAWTNAYLNGEITIDYLPTESQ